jgi:hypothetical protein
MDGWIDGCLPQLSINHKFNQYEIIKNKEQAEIFDKIELKHISISCYMLK